MTSALNPDLQPKFLAANDCAPDMIRLYGTCDDELRLLVLGGVEEHEVLYGGLKDG